MTTARHQRSPRVPEMLLMVETAKESNNLREAAIAAVRQSFTEIAGLQNESQRREFEDFLNVALNHTLLRGIVAGYREGFSDGCVSTRVQLKDNSQKALGKLVKPFQKSNEQHAYRKGVSDEFDRIRRLLKDDAQKVAARILRLHPDWDAEKICKELDSRGIELPQTLARQTGYRLWTEAIAVRGSAPSRRVEKYISRVRIAIKVVNSEKKWSSRLERRAVSSTS